MRLFFHGGEVCGAVGVDLNYTWVLSEYRRIIVLIVITVFICFVITIALLWRLGSRMRRNTVYLLIHPQMVFVLLLYLVALLGIKGQLSKKMWFVLALPSVAAFVVIALNPFLGWYFYYNEQNVYSYGPMTPVIFVCPIIQMCMALYVLIRHRMVLQKTSPICPMRSVRP